MIYPGQKAIDYLASKIDKTDPGESSHWRKYHSEFEFHGNGFEGLEGFGGSERPYRGIYLLAHRLLQRKFRRMGLEYSEFSAIDSLARDMTRRQERAYDLDVLRQSLTLSFLKKKEPDIFAQKLTAGVIGDGFASMTVLLLASGSASRVVLVNLTKTLLVDLWYLKLWMGVENFESSVNLVTDGGDLADAFDKTQVDNTGVGRVIAIEAMHHDLLKECPIDLALNIVSMQEMDPPAVVSYFEDLRAVAAQRRLVFYCCNRDEKTLPDGTVTSFREYPWEEKDQVMIDELCPWHQQYYTLNRPFYRPYDGPIRHRLLRLA